MDKDQENIKYKNVTRITFVTNNERNKMKVEEMRGIWRGKKFKTKICPNNTRNEAIICFSFEGEAQLDVTKINAYIVWKAELYKSIRKSRESERGAEIR